MEVLSVTEGGSPVPVRRALDMASHGQRWDQPVEGSVSVLTAKRVSATGATVHEDVTYVSAHVAIQCSIFGIGCWTTDVSIACKGAFVQPRQC